MSWDRNRWRFQYGTWLTGQAPLVKQNQLKMNRRTIQSSHEWFPGTDLDRPVGIFKGTLAICTKPHSNLGRWDSEALQIAGWRNRLGQAVPLSWERIPLWAVERSESEAGLLQAMGLLSTWALSQAGTSGAASAPWILAAHCPSGEHARRTLRMWDQKSFFSKDPT